MAKHKRKSHRRRHLGAFDMGSVAWGTLAVGAAIGVAGYYYWAKGAEKKKKEEEEPAAGGGTAGLGYMKSYGIYAPSQKYFASRYY